MKDYIAVHITAKSGQEIVYDLLADQLSSIGYDSFSVEEGVLHAYIQAQDYDAEKLQAELNNFIMDETFNFHSELIKGENWNEEWEKNYFQPIIIDDKCLIHSSFHKGLPEAKYKIIIDPKMSFGTGHHATTSNMIRLILESDVSGKKIIDMGTGTGILAILCKMCGAKEVYGIEIDPYAKENADENIVLNSIKAEIICGDVASLKNLPQVDFFLANINRNIILNDMIYYNEKIKPGGYLYLSGFYLKDVNKINEVATGLGFTLIDYKTENKWAALKFRKNML